MMCMLAYVNAFLRVYEMVEKEWKDIVTVYSEGYTYLQMLHKHVLIKHVFVLMYLLENITYEILISDRNGCISRRK